MAKMEGRSACLLLLAYCLFAGLNNMSLRYVRRVQRGAYMWWKRLNWVKTGSKCANLTCLCTPHI